MTPNILVEDLKNCYGKPINNHCIITVGPNAYFKSYDVIVAMISYSDQKESVFLDRKYWCYSKTTRRYLSKFLGLTMSEIKQAVQSGKFSLTKLNGDSHYDNA